MSPWCYDEANVTIHFRANVQNRVFIVANWATLRIFATENIIKSENKRIMRITMTTIHL